MELRVQLTAGDTVEEIDIIEGSHVYCKQGDYFKDWNDLEATEKAGFIKIRDILEKAVSDIQPMMKHIQLCEERVM